MSPPSPAAAQHTFRRSLLATSMEQNSMLLRLRKTMSNFDPIGKLFYFSVMTLFRLLHSL